MRSQILSLIGGALGLAAIAASAPALSSDVCDTGLSTVFITIPQPVTVTVHDAQTKTATVYLTASADNALPTTTITRVYTLSSTTTEPYVDTIYLTGIATSGDAAAISTPASYETAVTQTALVTFTLHNGPTPTSSSSLLAFIVENGTTFWYGGQTPTKSYKVQTSVVTIVPVDTHYTSTLTIQSTVYTTRPHTVTQTLSASNQTTQASGVHVPSYGTDPAHSTTSWGGWNVTSTVGGILATDPARTSKSGLSLITQETVDIYHHTSEFSYTVSSYTAKGGFNAFTTPSTNVDAPSSTGTTTAEGTSTSEGAWTTAVVDGQTVSWSGHGVTKTCTDSSTAAPYANITSSTHHQPTSAVDGALKSSGSYSYSYTSALTITYSTLAPSSATSTALGVVTSSLSNSSPDPTSSVLSISSSSSSSKWYIYGPASSASDLASSTSTILGSAALFSSSSTVAVSSGSSPVTASSHMGVFPSESSISFLTSYIPTPSVADSSTKTSGTVSLATSTPSKCGEIGDFILNFDDIPPLSISNQSTDFQPAPIFNPYHKFDFSNGFTVVPPPVDPYLPESKPLLLEFIPNFTVNASTQQSGPNSRQGGFSGEIGNVDHGSTGCFSFNFYGASFGCDSLGPDCDFTFTGFRYDSATGQTNSVVTQQLAVKACPSLKSLDCVLKSVTLDNTFQSLDSIQINVTVQAQPKIWWMDDVRLGWSDNTCEMGICRTKAPIH